MKDILSKLFSILKYILLIISFGLVFFGIMTTYARLDKSLTEAVEIFIPFVFVLIMYLINIIVRSKAIGKNLLFNFVSCMVFVVTIIICLRSQFDKSMLLFYKYELNFNPAFFADNLSAIEFMLYMIGSVNILLLLVELFSKGTTKNSFNSIYDNKDVNSVIKDEGKEGPETITDAVIEAKKRKRQSE